MADIKTFVQDARNKGLTDDQIRSALLAQKWDIAIIDLALIGLEVPAADDSSSPTPVAPTKAQQPSLGHLMAALQHVLLWFFTGASSIAIAGVVTSLLGSYVSSETLASMIAVTLITFTPYAIFFLLFLGKARRTPGLIPGKVWSIITICLHSVGAMAAAITLVITVIVSGQLNVLVSAALILTLYLIIVITYGVAAFGPIRFRRLRQIVTIAHLPLLAVLFGSLFIMSLLQLGPAKHDEEVRKELTQIAQNVYTYAESHNSLPENNSDVVKSSQVTYARKSTTTYELCATFKINNRAYANTYESSSKTIRDDYVYESQFYAPRTGQYCFTLTSSPLDKSSNWDY
jgi:hypothetical protein